LIAEAHADTAAKATEGFTITDSGLALRSTGSQPHDTTPFSFLKLQGFCGFFVGPDQCDRLIFKTYCTRYFAFHMKPPFKFAVTAVIEW